MARLKIDMPTHFIFSTTIPVRITDLNYGGHVGNDKVLSLIHEARMQFLNHFDYEELNFAGVGLIMSDVVVEFKNELFYGDQVIAWVATDNFSKVAFDLFYKLEKVSNGTNVPVAFAKTGMVCFDYARKKIAAVPREVVDKLRQVKG